MDATTARARLLLGAALPPAPPVIPIPGYQLIEELGRGGIGTVYRARRESDGALVALKIIHPAFAANQNQRRWVQYGTALAMTLRHRHIVRIHRQDEANGQLFVEMELVVGRNLDQTLDESLPQWQAAALLMNIARAVQHAHEHGVLHRDLKPANILIDGDREPHLTDFDLARPAERAAHQQSRLIAGAPPYMAPEQLSGEASFHTDIYGLGVILYEMLAGRVPFGCDGESDHQLQQMIRHAPPVPPRAHDRRIDRRLQTVCLTCLEKQPARRYPTAAALADDLEHALWGEPTLARPRAAPVRAWRWARRHPRIAAIGGGALLLAGAALAIALGLWRARAREQARVLETNAFIASGQAGAMLFQLRAYADGVERAAREPRVRALLAGGRAVDPAPSLAALVPGFDSAVLETNQARIVAQWPSPAPFVFGRSYDFRDYFRGARALARAGARGVHVSRAFRSESHGILAFALATPVLDEDGTPIGILAATFNAKAAFGAVRMQPNAAEGARITTALIGPRGSDRGEGPDTATPARFSFLVHPGLPPGVEYALQPPMPARLFSAFGAAAPPGEQFSMEYVSPLEVTDYRDPVPGFEESWLAAFAPVGKTGLVVLVETRKDGWRWPALLAHGRPTPAAIWLASPLPVLAAGTLLRARRRRRSPAS